MFDNMLYVGLSSVEVIAVFSQCRISVPVQALVASSSDKYYKYHTNITSCLIIHVTNKALVAGINMYMVCFSSTSEI